MDQIEKKRKPKAPPEGTEIHEIVETEEQEVGYESAYLIPGMTMYELVLSLASNPSIVDSSKSPRHNAAVLFEQAEAIISKLKEVDA